MIISSINEVKNMDMRYLWSKINAKKKAIYFIYEVNHTIWSTVQVLAAYWALMLKINGELMKGPWENVSSNNI